MVTGHYCGQAVEREKYGRHIAMGISSTIIGVTHQRMNIFFFFFFSFSFSLLLVKKVAM